MPARFQSPFPARLLSQHTETAPAAVPLEPSLSPMHNAVSAQGSLSVSAPALSRRQHLKVLGLLPLAWVLPLPSARAAELGCTLASQMTEGPYWVDEKLNRADITTNTTRSSVLNATPMTLDMQFYDSNGQACGSNPAKGVQVDIWHCDAAGEYSDASGNGQSNTVGQTFLRGYQVTDASGRVSFKTIYPGWYSGRATHIHLRARIYSAAGNTTYNFVSQLFFSDTFTDAIYTATPYNARGTRNTRNSNDSIYRSASTPLELLLAQRSDGSVQAELAIGLAGLPTEATFRSFSAVATNTGSASVPELRCDLVVASNDTGATGEIYVAAEIGDAVFFNNGSEWVAVSNPAISGFPAFYRGTLGATHRLTLLSGVNTSAVGRARLYVGYGRDNQDMIANQRFDHIYTLNP
jgi:protocatechuate 3,4-dioxygenase beta subunit